MNKSGSIAGSIFWFLVGTVFGATIINWLWKLIKGKLGI